ncbi:MAG: cation-translocating P-type ATPase, partial [Gloeobacteraceae cyanobacterium ES-bin-316]|nr:cation-translocating P-type ATPase [Ferruginibacter sp.]
MEKVDWKVEGMTCSNCALSISKYLNKEGAKEVKVNSINGAVSFTGKEATSLQGLKKGINSLGYTVLNPDDHHGHDHNQGTGWWPFLATNKKRLLFCLPFTLVLMLHMIEKWVPLHWLMNPWVQMVLCLPVFLVGMAYFGKSALKSIMHGMPNMNVLVALGSLAAFVYSLAGTILNLGHEYLFFETAASIITLVLLGNYMEEASIQSTQRAVKS